MIDETKLTLGPEDYAFIIRAEEENIEIILPGGEEGASQQISENGLMLVALSMLLERDDKELMEVIYKEVQAIIKNIEEGEEEN